MTLDLVCSAGVGAGWFYLGHGERYQIEGYESTGVLRRVVRKRAGPVPTTDADINELMEAGSDYVLGVWHDELDVEHVRVYDLIRNSTSDGD